MTSSAGRREGYATTLDRAGWALGVGGLLGGVMAMLLLAMGGGATFGSLCLALLLGGLLSALGVTAVAGPIWLILHALGHRGPRAAASVAAGTAFAVFLAGQTHVFGLSPNPPSDARTLAMRWLSGAGTSVLLAGLAALVGLAMWRVAYRRR
jgi:hypothetical protein